jgi:DNA polymerase-3 subunit delta
MPDAAIKPIYVLHGDDGFLRDAHRREIVERLIGPADPQLAVAVFEPDAPLADVLDELRTAPFLAPRRVVVVRDADAFVTAHRAALERYLAAPAASAALMLLVTTWNPKWRLARIVEDIGRRVDCSVPQRGSLAAWIAKAARKRGKKLAPDAAELLEQWIGRDLAALDGEIEKLSIYAGERETVTVEDVSALVTSTAGPAAFALTNALTAGDAKAALDALGGMLTARGEEFRTLGLIAWHLRRALSAKEQMATGGSPDVRMPPRQRSAFLAMVRRRPMRRMERDFARLLEADLGMKSGLEPQAALQSLVVGLCA